MTEELKPCPFCGSANISEGEVLTEALDGKTCTQSMCESCGALGPEARLSQGEIDYGGVKANAAWNRRVLSKKPVLKREPAKVCGQCAYVRKFHNDPERFCSNTCAYKAGNS